LADSGPRASVWTADDEDEICVLSYRIEEL